MDTPPVPSVRTHWSGSSAPSVTRTLHAVRPATGRVEACAAPSPFGTGRTARSGKDYLLRREPRTGDSERGSDIALLERPVDPIRDEVRHDPIALRHPGDTLSDGRDRAGGVAHGNGGKRDVGVVEALHDEKVAVVQAECFDVEVELTWPRRGRLPLGEIELVEVEGSEFVSAHRVTSGGSRRYYARFLVYE